MLPGVFVCGPCVVLCVNDLCIEEACFVYAMIEFDVEQVAIHLQATKKTDKKCFTPP
jgi:hypothetical protein